MGGSVAAQSNPWQVIDDFHRATAGLGLVGILTSAALLQIVFNVASFVPFGMLLRYYARRFGVSVAVMAASSVFIEVIQATGAFAIYPCAYRLGDTADVVLNTAGGTLGWLLACWR